MSFDPKSKHFMATQVNMQITHVIFTVWGTVHEHTVMQLMPELLQQAKDETDTCSPER